MIVRYIHRQFELTLQTQLYEQSYPAIVHKVLPDLVFLSDLVGLQDVLNEKMSLPFYTLSPLSLLRQVQLRGSEENWLVAE